MNSKLQELWSFIKAQGAGLVSVGVDWGVLSLLIAVFDVHYILAAVCGNVGGAITEFSLKRWLVFESGTSLALPTQALRYGVTSVLSAGLNALTSWLVIGQLGMPKFPWIFVTSTFGGLIWTYPMHRFWVYRAEPAATTAGTSEG